MEILLVDRAGRTREVLSAEDDELAIPGRGVLSVEAIPPHWLQGGVIPRARGLVPAIHGRAVPRSRADAALLLLVAGQWGEVLDLDRDLAQHVTLSFALPLSLAATWREWVLANLDLVMAGRQLVVVPASDLVAVDPSELPVEAVLRRHRRLFRRHRATSVHPSSPETVLAWWERFSEERYARRPYRDELSALVRIASMAECEAREVRADGHVVAASLICRHGPTRTMFDLLAPWDTTRAELRPGVYSAVANLLEARREHLRYCLCYGRFPYKEEVVGGLPRLRLADLAAPVLVGDHLVQERH